MLMVLATIERGGAIAVGVVIVRLRRLLKAALVIAGDVGRPTAVVTAGQGHITSAWRGHARGAGVGR